VYRLFQDRTDNHGLVILHLLLDPPSDDRMRRLNWVLDLNFVQCGGDGGDDGPYNPDADDSLRRLVLERRQPPVLDQLVSVCVARSLWLRSHCH
jgi:hypothetical protein